MAGFVLGVVATYFGGSRGRPTEPQPPEIGGQKAPDAVREIDFGKRYDAHCSFVGNELTVFHGCKVVGFTGPAAPRAEESSGGSGFSSRAFYQHFDRWLILELGDGRRAFIPTSSLRYLETSKTQ